MADDNQGAAPGAGERIVRILLAAVVTGVAFGLALVLRPLIDTGGEPLFILAIAISAALGGLAPGLLALVLSIVALNWWFVPPEGAFGFQTTTDLLGQLIFSISGLLVAVLVARARALQRWAESRAAEAEFQLQGAEGRLARSLRRDVIVGQKRDRPPPLQETVLIVDPDAEARQLASRAVEGAGYRWVSACDGVEALELLDRYDVPFALVVTDVGLPDIPGPELMRRVAERRPGLPVLYTSARPGAAAPDGATPTGQPLLEKPYTPDELIRRTRDLLDAPGRRGEAAT